MIFAHPRPSNDLVQVYMHTHTRHHFQYVISLIRQVKYSSLSLLDLPTSSAKTYSNIRREKYAIIPQEAVCEWRVKVKRITPAAVVEYRARIRTEQKRAE